MPWREPLILECFLDILTLNDQVVDSSFVSTQSFPCVRLMLLKSETFFMTIHPPLFSVKLLRWVGYLHVSHLLCDFGLFL